MRRPCDYSSNLLTHGLESRKIVLMLKSSRWHQSATASHIVRFFMYNVVGALLPLSISWVVRKLGEVQAAPGAYAPELLFFGVMVSVTALGDLTDEEQSVGADWMIQLLKATLLFGALAVSSIFGVYQYDVIFGSNNVTFRDNITLFAVTSSGSLFLASFLAEIVVAKIRGSVNELSSVS